MANDDFGRRREDWVIEDSPLLLGVVALDLPTSHMMMIKDADDFSSRIFAAINAMLLDIVAAIARKGALYRRKRPVHWCPRDRTALAEAEVEYAEKTSPSIYVRFPVTSGGPEGWGLAIWTTTPWTIPANLAITANPDLEYVAYDLPRHGVTVVAKDLLHSFLKECAPEELSQGSDARGDDLVSAARATGATLKHPQRIKKTLQGSDLAGWKYRHPLIARESPVVLGAHATAETGTGLVHTAPGHGEDDFNIGVEHGLPIWAPVDGQGRFTADVGIEGLDGADRIHLDRDDLFGSGAYVIFLRDARGAVPSHECNHRCQKPLMNNQLSSFPQVPPIDQFGLLSPTRLVCDSPGLQRRHDGRD